jgi:hypothetical protein
MKENIPSAESNTKILLKSLDLAEQRRRHHHDALWKEEVHYTWLSYIIAGSLIFLFSTFIGRNIDSATFIGVMCIAIIFSFFGIILCSIGFKVIRLESIYYGCACRACDKIRSDIDKIFEDDVQKNSELKNIYNLIRPGRLKQLLNINRPPYSSTDKFEGYGIRDLFQITMLLPIIFFIFSIAYSIFLIVLRIR